jgi:hypothetical protein
MSWDAELQQKWRKILLVFDNCAAHPHLDSLKVFQHNIAGTANGHGTHKKFEDLISCTVGKLHP